LASSSSSGESLALYQQHENSNFSTAGVYGVTMVMTVIGISWFLLAVGTEVLATPWQRRSVARRSWRRRDDTVTDSSKVH
jgi:hypothetical protein